ncbi:MAG: hypothetical protein A3J25_19170 [Pseudomonadales bacterium RIFCSPLOWO2_02_FULL_63_210]|nr:MAG: hypothetical protein A3J25_19170 [Pseudomonadales bacterium RIFCSPLOWO2_02_FULL_63_210]
MPDQDALRIGARLALVIDAEDDVLGIEKAIRACRVAETRAVDGRNTVLAGTAGQHCARIRLVTGRQQAGRPLWRHGQGRAADALTQRQGRAKRAWV